MIDRAIYELVEILIRPISGSAIDFTGTSHVESTWSERDTILDASQMSLQANECWKLKNDVAH